MLLMLLTNFAAADTYDVELAVPSVHPTWMKPAVLQGAKRHLVQTERSDQEVAAANPLVVCRVEDGWLTVALEADKASYPSLPFSTSCSLGGHTMAIDVVAVAPAVDSALNPPWIASDGSITIGKIAGERHIQRYELPDCGANFVLKKYSSGLSGVRCKVEEFGGVYRVRVASNSTAATGTGTCNLLLTDGTTYPLTLHLSEGSI